MRQASIGEKTCLNAYLLHAFWILHPLSGPMHMKIFLGPTSKSEPMAIQFSKIF